MCIYTRVCVYVGVCVGVCWCVCVCERRSMWGCFRLENEHLHNTEGYRRVDIIPLHFETPLEEETPEAKQKRESGGRLLVAAEVMTFVVIVVTLILVAIFLDGHSIKHHGGNHTAGLNRTA